MELPGKIRSALEKRMKKLDRECFTGNMLGDAITFVWDALEKDEYRTFLESDMMKMRRE
jgi:hypothetical protein